MNALASVGAALLLLNWSLPLTAQAVAASDEERIDRIVDAVMQEQHIPAATVAVAVDGLVL